jgi:hypothetical protein
MSITLRSVKGSRLTHAELDTNFTDLRDGVNAQVPKTAGSGIKIGPNGSESYAWHDLVSTMHVDPSSPVAPTFATFRGNIKGRQFDEGEEAYVEFHIPHDYVPGTDLYIHAHWAHNSTVVTGGTVTFGFEITYARGWATEAFSSSITVAAVDTASTTQYMHKIAETQFTGATDSSNSIDRDRIEVDGILMVRFYLDSNDITTSNASTVAPFITFVDVHYQSTNVGTKNKVPSFYA